MCCGCQHATDTGGQHVGLCVRGADTVGLQAMLYFWLMSGVSPPCRPILSVAKMTTDIVGRQCWPTGRVVQPLPARTAIGLTLFVTPG